MHAMILKMVINEEGQDHKGLSKEDDDDSIIAFDDDLLCNRNFEENMKCLLWMTLTS